MRLQHCCLQSNVGRCFVVPAFVDTELILDQLDCIADVAQRLYDVLSECIQAHVACLHAFLNCIDCLRLYAQRVCHCARAGGIAKYIAALYTGASLPCTNASGRCNFSLPRRCAQLSRVSRIQSCGSICGSIAGWCTTNQAGASARQSYLEPKPRGAALVISFGIHGSIL